MIVAIEQARSAVARDVDVRPAVVVEIGRRRAHPVGSGRPPVGADEDHRGRSTRLRNPRRFRHVGEGPVAAVAIEAIGAAGIAERPARDGDVVVAAVGRLTGPRRLLRIEVHVTGDEQIQQPVTVVVDEAAARAPHARRPGHAGLLGHVGEGAVAVVAVEDVPSPAGHEQIVEAVVVEVPDAAAPGPSRNASGPPSW